MNFNFLWFMGKLRNWGTSSSFFSLLRYNPHPIRNRTHKTTFLRWLTFFVITQKLYFLVWFLVRFLIIQ
jgi:hypothetical protein